MMPTSYPRAANTAVTLAAIPIPIDPPTVRMIATITGTGAIGDGNGGAYYWDYESVAVPDGFNYIASDNATYAAAGRWIRFPMEAPTPGQASAPVFSPVNGSFTTTVTVSITSATVGAAIYYTVNGGAEILYTIPFILSVTSVLTAVARMTGLGDSSVTNKTYTKVNTPPATDWSGYFGSSADPLLAETSWDADFTGGQLSGGDFFTFTETDWTTLDHFISFGDTVGLGGGCPGPYRYYIRQSIADPPNTPAGSGFFTSLPLNAGDMAGAADGYTDTDSHGWPCLIVTRTDLSVWVMYRLLNAVNAAFSLRIRSNEGP